MTIQGPAVVDDHVFLIGRPPLGEYLGFVTVQTVGGDKLDVRAITDEWRAANDHVRELEQLESGWADRPATTELPPQLASLMQKLLADPIFHRSFAIVPTTVSMVELDRLVVFQKDINLAYVREIQAKIGPHPTPEQVFKVCLPFDHPQPPVSSGRIATNAYVFGSPSTDLRFVEATVIAMDQIQGYLPQGPVSGIVALVIGFGSNFLNAIAAENRLVLNNGSHRAFALRELGITHVPCVLQHVSRPEELAVVAGTDLQQNTELYLKSKRPPVLKDYFDVKLRKPVKVLRRYRQVKIAFGVEQLDVPASQA